MSQTGFMLRSSSRCNSKILRAESAEGSYGQAAWRRDFRVSDARIVMQIPPAEWLSRTFRENSSISEIAISPVSFAAGRHFVTFALLRS